MAARDLGSCLFWLPSLSLQISWVLLLQALWPTTIGSHHPEFTCNSSPYTEMDSPSNCQSNVPGERIWAQSLGHWIRSSWEWGDLRIEMWLPGSWGEGTALQEVGNECCDWRDTPKGATAEVTEWWSQHPPHTQPSSCPKGSLCSGNRVWAYRTWSWTSFNIRTKLYKAPGASFSIYCNLLALNYTSHVITK